MGEAQECWGRLRALLTHSPSREWLRLLLKELEAWPDESKALAFVYTQEHLESWPCEERQPGGRLKLLEVWPTFPEGRALESAKLLRSLYATSGFKEEEDVSVRNLEALLQNEQFASVQELNLSVSRFKGFSSCLAKATSWTSVRRFDASNCEQGPELVEALVDGKLFPALEELDVSFNPLGYRGGELLAKYADERPLLRKLTLKCCKLQNKGWRALAQGSFPALEELNVYRNELKGGNSRVFGRCNPFPALKTLTFGQKTIQGKKIASILRKTQFPQLEKLSLGSSPLGPEGAQLLANSPLLEQLNELNLRNTKLGYEGLRYLSESKAMASVERLDLGSNGLRNEAMELFAQTQIPWKLKRLNLNESFGWGENNNSFKEEGCALLATAPFFHGLGELLLANVGMTSAGLRALFSGRSLPNLRVLELGYCHFDENGPDAFTHTELSNLEHLSFCPSYRVDWMEKFAKTSAFSNLSTLALRAGSIASADVGYLSASDTFSSLKVLDLAHNKVYKEGVKILVDLGAFPHLEELDLSNNWIQAAGTQALVNAVFCPNLKTLKLAGNQLFEGFGALARHSERFTQLEDLDVTENNLGGDAVVKAFVDHARFPNLRWLSISRDGVSDNGLAWLEACADERGFCVDVVFDEPAAW